MVYLTSLPIVTSSELREGTERSQHDLITGIKGGDS